MIIRILNQILQTMKKNLSALLLLSLLVLYVSCGKPISKEDKIITVAKISTLPVFSKNGAKKVTWFYLGKQYFDTRSFDARRFTYGDKFLLYIDKNNPNHNEYLRPLVKFDNFTSLPKNLEYPFKLEEPDLMQLDRAE